MNVALADGYIANFESKYHFIWRPITAITSGDTDGNPDTAGDSTWMSYLETPPVPDYPSGHSTVGAAAARALEHAFSNDFIPFSMTSGPPYAGITRRFWSFSEAAHENAASRVLAGIHFGTPREVDSCKAKKLQITSTLICSNGFGEVGHVDRWLVDFAL